MEKRGAGAHNANVTVSSVALSGTPNAISVTQSGADAQSATVNASGAGITLNITQQP